MLQIEFSSQVVLHLRYKTIDFQTGPEGCVTDIGAKSGFPDIVINLSLKGFSFDVTETLQCHD